MNGIMLLMGLNYIDRKYIEEVEMEQLPSMLGRKTLRRYLFMAAVIALTLLLVGCVAYVLNMEDLVFSGGSEIIPAHYDENGTFVPETELSGARISMQGFEGSQGYEAAKEWHEFESDYDMTKAAAQAEESGFQRPKEYEAYFVYNQEMMDKIDEIAEKYGLQLAGAFVPVQKYDYIKRFQAFGIEDLHHEKVNAAVRYGSGYFYSCGNFDISFDIKLTGENEVWPHTVNAQMHYSGKAYLDTVYSGINCQQDYDQWMYTMPDGHEVFIFRSDTFARIILDREDAFITVSFGTSYIDDLGNVEYMTNRDVELVADVIDFAVQTHQADMEEIE